MVLLDFSSLSISCSISLLRGAGHTGYNFISLLNLFWVRVVTLLADAPWQLSLKTKKPLKSIYWLQNIFFKDASPKAQYIDLNGLVICNDNNSIISSYLWYVKCWYVTRCTMQAIYNYKLVSLKVATTWAIEFAFTYQHDWGLYRCHAVNDQLPHTLSLQTRSTNPHACWCLSFQAVEV